LALQFAGSAIAMVGGFGGMAGSTVEEAEPQAPLTAIITLSALILLFVFDFHREIFRALVLSYEIAPLSSYFNTHGALLDVTETLAQSFYLTLRLARPFIAYAILVNLGIGFINK